MDIRNEIKSHIVREGMTIKDVIARLVLRHRWSASVSNFTGKLRRGTLKYTEAIAAPESQRERKKERVHQCTGRTEENPGRFSVVFECLPW